jgi:hypothetical protein
MKLLNDGGEFPGKRTAQKKEKAMPSNFTLKLGAGW